MKNTDISDIYSRAAAPIEDFCAAFQNALNALNFFERGVSFRDNSDVISNADVRRYRENDNLSKNVERQNRLLENLRSVGDFFSADNKNYNRDNSTRQSGFYHTETYSAPNNTVGYSRYMRNSTVDANSVFHNGSFPVATNLTPAERYVPVSASSAGGVKLIRGIHGAAVSPKYSTKTAASVSSLDGFNGYSKNYFAGTGGRGYAFFDYVNNRWSNTLFPRNSALYNGGGDVFASSRNSVGVSAPNQAPSSAFLRDAVGGNVSNHAAGNYSDTSPASSALSRRISNEGSVFNSRMSKRLSLFGAIGGDFFYSEKYFSDMPRINRNTLLRTADGGDVFNFRSAKRLSLRNTNGGNGIDFVRNLSAAPRTARDDSRQNSSVGYFSDCVKNISDLLKIEQTVTSNNVRTNNEFGRNISYADAARAYVPRGFENVFVNADSRQSYRGIQSEPISNFYGNSAPVYRSDNFTYQSSCDDNAVGIQIPARLSFSDSGQSESIREIENALQPVSEYMYQIGNAPLDNIREGLSSSANDLVIFGNSASSALFSFVGMSSAAAAWNGYVPLFAAAAGAAAGYAAVLGVLTAVMLSAAQAQGMLNGFILACPVLWIVDGISAFVGIMGAAAQGIGNVHAVAAAFGGMMGGCFMTAIAGVGNSFIAFYNLIAQGFAASQNITADFANFLLNVFQNPLRAVVQLFAGAFGSVLSIIESAADAVGGLLGQDFGGNISALKQKLQSAVDKKYGQNTEYVKKVDLHAFDMKYLDYNKFFKTGYTAGSYFNKNTASNSEYNLGRIQGAASSVNLNCGLNNFFNISGVNAQTDKSKTGTSLRTYGTSRSTAKSSAVSSSAVTNEDIEYIRDIAEREVTNRFTTAEISVSMGGITQNVNSDADLDGIVNYLANGVRDAMEKCAEGVHA